MATNADPTVAAAAASLASVDAAADDAFDQAITELPTPTPEVQLPSAAEAPAQTAKEPEPGSDPAEAPTVAAGTSDEPEEYRNLLTKFNGDKGAAAKWSWENNNRAAQLAKEKAELEERLKALEPASNAEVKTPPAPEIPADLRRYDDKIRVTQDTYRNTATQFSQWKAQAEKLETEISDIVRKLGSRDLTLDRDALNDQLVQAYEKRDAANHNQSVLQDRLDALNEKWEELTHNRALAERLVAQERFVIEAREAKARSEEDAQVAAIRTQFNGTIDKLTADTSLVPEALAGRAKSYVIRAVKAQLADNLPIADIEKFTRDEITEFMAAAKAFHSAQSTEYAKLKQADAAMNAPTGPKAVASETKAPRADWTPAQWDQYLENAQL